MKDFKIVEEKVIDNIELVKHSIDIHKIGKIENKTIIKCYKGDDLITWCVISPTDEKLMTDFFKVNVDYLTDEERKEYFKDFKDFIYLDLIKSEIKNQGGAKAIINHLKSKNKKVWLYSTCEAMDFYDKMDFNNYDGEYIYYI